MLEDVSAFSALSLIICASSSFKFNRTSAGKTSSPSTNDVTLIEPISTDEIRDILTSQ